MTDNNHAITEELAVVAPVGTKGNEEHELPSSLRNNMELCLQILREVLNEFDPKLLNMFDEVRTDAVEASAEHFAGFLDDSDHGNEGLRKAVEIIDAMNLHDAQLMARAFTTYFHLANLCEENHRVSVLRQRESEVDESQAVDPVNELTVVYHQLITEMGPAKAKALLEKLEFHPVFTAHPTEARRKAVEGKIRRIAELLEVRPLLGGSEKRENYRRLFNEIDALFRTSPIEHRKPTPVEEANTIIDIFDSTLFDTIPQVYRRFDDWLLGDQAGLVPPACPAFFHPGSWIGSDRDGNPNVTAKVSRQVARNFSDHVIAALEDATRTVGKNLTMDSEATPASEELRLLWGPSEGDERAAHPERRPALRQGAAPRGHAGHGRSPALHHRARHGSDVPQLRGFPGRSEDRAALLGRQRPAFGLRPAAGSDLAGRNLRLPHGGDGVPPAFRGAFTRPGGHPGARPAWRARPAAADDAGGARHLPRPGRHPEAQRHEGRRTVHHLVHQVGAERARRVRAQPPGVLESEGCAGHRRHPAVRAAGGSAELGERA